MITVTLIKFRHRMTANEVDLGPKAIKEAGGKLLSAYWTLGRFDAVATVEWPNEKAAMSAWSKVSDILSTETLIGIPREEALKLAGY